MFASIGAFFNTLLVHPLFNSLVFLYNTVAIEDFGLAVIFLTIVIRLLLWPLTQKAISSQKRLQELQPHIKEIQKKHKENQEEQAKALMELYKERGANPFGGCLPLLIQLPILFALYRVFLGGISPEYLQNLYSFVQNPGHLNTTLLGLVDLSHRSLVLAVIAGGLQFIQSKMMMKRNPLPQGEGAAALAAQMMSKQMVFVLPVITILISLSLPAALPLYWAITTLFTIAQQFVTMRAVKPEK